MSTGFFGKIPATGDFVSRGLPPEFVRLWDPWVARHLAPLAISGTWPESQPICFLLGTDMAGPAAGVALPSMDRAGRRFPLSVVAPVRVAATTLALTAVDWFNDAAAAANAARNGDLTADELAVALAALPFPQGDEGGAGIGQMILWVDPDDLFHVDPELPGAVLERLLSVSWETT
jgi:type VI secretion system protein ImpM